MVMLLGKRHPPKYNNRMQRKGRRVKKLDCSKLLSSLLSLTHNLIQFFKNSYFKKTIYLVQLISSPSSIPVSSTTPKGSSTKY